MSGNTFGDIFKITTFGESHGEFIGVTIEGCPSGLFLDLAFMQNFMDKRRPGVNRYVSPRKEIDTIHVISGVYEQMTTGTPLTILIKNENHNSNDYDKLKQIYRPGHANYTYLAKYGIFDPCGGGRASARETVARVAAGSVALLILKKFNIEIDCFLTQVGPHICGNWDQISSIISCPDSEVEKEILKYLDFLITTGDSVGGVVTGLIKQVPAGLGEPVFDKFEAMLAHAVLSIPATKGFEIGEGFASAEFLGSMFNDEFDLKDEQIYLKSNHAGGTLGGITSGQDVVFRTVFKPTSSIKKLQNSVTIDNKRIEFAIDSLARHDPCVAIRGVIVVKAMAALVTCDFLLKTRLNKITYATCS